MRRRRCGLGVYCERDGRCGLGVYCERDGHCGCGAYYRLLLDGDGAGFERYALSAAILPAALCDRINELLYDDIGDSIAEHTASGYAITEDYRDEAEEFLRSCGSGR